METKGCRKNSLSYRWRDASPLGDGASDETGTISALPKAPSVRELANPKDLTEGVLGENYFKL